MYPVTTLVAQLRRTIGSPVQYNGVRCTVVELLEEPLCLVLQRVGASTTIQESQFGNPQRLVTTVYTIPCLSEEGGLHQELRSLGLSLE